MLAAACLCILLQYFTPSNAKQKIIRADTKIDITYWLLENTILGLVIKFFIVLLIATMLGFGLFKLAGLSYIKSLEVQYQVIIIIIIIDFTGYWIHRFFHGGFRWKFHSIHHSSKEIDWLSSARFHPLETMFIITIQYLVAAVFVGYDNKLIGVAMIIRSTYGYFVHANVSWNFGVLRYVFCSPVFHRWHHTKEQAGIDKNFGGLFSCWDYIFGTVYLPNKGNAQPFNFGVKNDVGNSFAKQLLYPFKK